ncbi:hypothetical protein [Brevundimonas sp.]|uniref:hypothetical protein n=1 Tax=Brevundimonas sp. TaxID=1871086 RepID=UPI0028A205F8|nr:hypothetical protein [Brevundimonas sp.]
MLPTLIVLLLVVVAVAAIVWVVRKGPKHTPRPGEDQDTAWNDPITPADRDSRP